MSRSSFRPAPKPLAPPGSSCFQTFAAYYPDFLSTASRNCRSPGPRQNGKVAVQDRRRGVPDAAPAFPEIFLPQFGSVEVEAIHSRRAEADDNALAVNDRRHQAKGLVGCVASLSS